MQEGRWNMDGQELNAGNGPKTGDTENGILLVDVKSLRADLKKVLEHFLVLNHEYNIRGGKARKTNSGNIAVSLYGIDIYYFNPKTLAVQASMDKQQIRNICMDKHQFCEALQQKLNSYDAPIKNLDHFVVKWLSGWEYEVSLVMQKGCLYTKEPIVRAVKPGASTDEEFELVARKLEEMPFCLKSPFPWKKMKERAIGIIRRERPLALTEEEIKRANSPFFLKLFKPEYIKSLEAYAPEPSLKKMEAFTIPSPSGCTVAIGYGDVKAAISLLDGSESALGFSKNHAAVFLNAVKKMKWLDEFMKEAESVFPGKDLSYDIDMESITASIKDKPVSATAGLGKAYKRVLSSMARELKSYEAKEEKARLKAVRTGYGYGEIAVTAFIETVMANEKYITESMVIKLLRGMSINTWNELTCPVEYEGKFEYVHSDTFSEICHNLIRRKIINTKTLKGTYGHFDILIVTDRCRDIAAGRQDLTPHRGEKKTEFQELEAIKHENPQEQKLQAVMARIDYLLKHPAVYCYGKEDVMNYLSGIPEQVLEYLKTVHKMEGPGIRKKYVKALIQAADRKETN